MGNWAKWVWNPGGHSEGTMTDGKLVDHGDHVSDVLDRQAEATERLAEAIEEQNDLLRNLVDAVAYGGGGR